MYNEEFGKKIDTREIQRKERSVQFYRSQILWHKRDKIETRPGIWLKVA